ncbi:hypothetical protein BC826DRAFT_966549 [Russula brevipes]|nr:hypothetical protein BC826DRAFT_966549 [Russula brevipes]
MISLNQNLQCNCQCASADGPATAEERKIRIRAPEDAADRPLWGYLLPSTRQKAASERLQWRGGVEFGVASFIDVVFNYGPWVGRRRRASVFWLGPPTVDHEERSVMLPVAILFNLFNWTNKVPSLAQCWAGWETQTRRRAQCSAAVQESADTLVTRIQVSEIRAFKFHFSIIVRGSEVVLS